MGGGAVTERWAAGCGVVADSDPVAEYEETRAKARGLFRAAEEAVRFAAGGR